MGQASGIGGEGTGITRGIGRTLEDLCGDGAIAELQGILSPLQQVLAQHDYLGGDGAGYGDYIVFGAFQWASVASTRRLVDDSPVGRWFLRLLNAFDGFAASQPNRSHWT